MPEFNPPNSVIGGVSRPFATPLPSAFNPPNPVTASTSTPIVTTVPPISETRIRMSLRVQRLRLTLEKICALSDNATVGATIVRSLADLALAWDDMEDGDADR